MFDVISLTVFELSFNLIVVNSRLSGTGSMFNAPVRSLAVSDIDDGAVITDGLNKV